MPPHRVPALIELAWGSVVGLAVAPLEELLNLGSDARMNQPGRAEGNWQWRYTAAMLTLAVRQWLRDLTCRASIRVTDVLPQGEKFPNACLLPHRNCSRPTRVQPCALGALPSKQAARDARFPSRRSEGAACSPLALYESAGSLIFRSSRCRPDSSGWLFDPRTRLWAARRRRTFSLRCSVRRCPSR